MANYKNKYSNEPFLGTVNLNSSASEKRDWFFLFFLALIFVLPLWPSYAELKFGAMPNLAPDRLIRTALILGFFWMIFNDRRRSQMFFRRLSNHWLLVSTLLAFYALRTASAFVASNATFQLFAFFRNDVFTILPIFFLSLAAINDAKSVSKVINVLIASGVIASLFALLDFYLKHNIFVGIVPVTNDYLMGVFLDKTRDSAYRAQGTFEHPIMLGQYFALMLPFIWVKFKESKKSGERIYYFIAALLAASSIYVSGSRGALGIALVILVMLLIWEIVLWIRTSRNRLAQYFVLSQFPWLIVCAFFGWYFLREMATGSTLETQSSSNARLEMLVGGFPKIFDAPFIGHGLGEAVDTFSLVGRAGIRTLDNFYLLLGIESGLAAPLIFIFFTAMTVPRLLRDVFSQKLQTVRLNFSCILLFIAYILMMAFHALSQQFWIVLLFSVVVIVNQEISTGVSGK